MKKPCGLLCVDPSLTRTGWAFFAWRDDAGWKLHSAGVFKQRRCTNEWVATMDKMVSQLREKLFVLRDEWEGRIVILVEQPELMLGGRGLAAHNSGAVMKLTAMVFTVRARCAELGLPCKLIPVSRWKGQVPKEVTQQRVRRYWGWSGTDHNEADAVGIGDWWVRKRKG